MLRQVRGFFDQRDFVEVETPVLSADTVVDRHLDPLRVTLFDDPRRPDVGRTLWLQTSPEFAMKRLLAAGATAVYQVARAFRAAEHGALHNPEFTLVEWYRAGDSLQQGMQLLGELSEILWQRGPAESISYLAAFEQHAGIDPHTADVALMAAAARSRRLQPPASLAEDRQEWLNWLTAELVQPQLGRRQPTIVYDYPADQAALAQVRPGPPAVAERFELFVDGIELANGYHELLNPQELVRRTEVVNAQRAADGKFELPSDSRLLSAMRHGLPDCTGVALGFDRAVMVAAGANSVAEVMAFPIERA